MDLIDSYILQGIFYYLDINSLEECCFVSKYWKEILRKDSFWKSKFRNPSLSSYHSGPYFKYPGYKTYLDYLDAESYNISDFTSIKSIAHKLENPQYLKIKHIEASSEYNGQSAIRVLNYDNLFWSSTPSESKESNEFLLFELSEYSFIFTVSFKSYRSYQQSTVYPPRFVKLSIGSTIECSDYETDEFEVGLTEKYNTISVLPKLTSGKFIKLHLLGKQSQAPETEKWFSMLRFVEIVGYPINFTPDPLLKLCREGKIDKISNVLSPFYFERLEKFGMIVKYLRQTILLDTDIASYMFEINKEKVERPQFQPTYCEILGNYFFDKGEYKLARKHYSRAMDIWGNLKVSIITKQFNEIFWMVTENNSRRPALAWVLKTARSLGGTELENIIAEQYKQYILDF